MIRTSVIIPHFNDLDNLRRCIDCLSAQTVGRETFEVIVADNRSAVGLEAVEAAVGHFAQVVDAEERGAGPARNVAVSHATGDVLAFIDSDCRPHPTWLEEGLAALEGAEAIGGVVRIAAEMPRKPRPVEAFEIVFAFDNERYIAKHGFSLTANMLMWRSSFDRVGAFRNGVSEDVDWGQRAAAIGLKIRYAPRVVVEHPARAQWPDLVKKWRRITIESYRLARERPLGRLRWFARNWAVLLSPVGHLPRILASRKLPSVESKAMAALVLFRIRLFRFAEANRVLLTE